MTAVLPAQRTPDAWRLVERAQAGDSDAMADIYRANYDTVFRYVYFRVGNRQLAEDLTGDVFLRAVKRIGTVQWQGRDIGAWLVTIAKNAVFDHFKSGRYRLEVAVGEMGDDERPAADPDAGPEDTTVEHLENAHARAALREALAGLTFEQQLAMALRYLDGLSIAETAAAMRKNEGAIKAMTYRATQRLSRDEQLRALVAA